MIGYCLIYVFAIELGWLPVQGYTRIGVDFWRVPRAHGAAVSVTLGIIYIALIARITRASILEVLNEDYIRTARAKGLSNRVVLMRHALRNAAVPILTVIGVGVALLIGGAVVTESVFGLPGLGRLTVEAVLSRDFPTIQAVILLFSVVYVRHQPDHRHQLHHLRPEDPLLSAIVPEEVVDSAAIASASTKRRSLWALAIRNPSVIFGGVILLIMLAIAILAPVLGTVDPTRIDPASRNKKPGTEITFRLEDGKTMKRVALMGTDSLGRDVYSRVLYGTRVSLIVGVAVAAVAVVARPGDRPGVGLHPLARRLHHAHHGRADGDPGHIARHRAGLDLARRPDRP